MSLGYLVVMLGGLALFLFGMKMMGDGLELCAGSKLRTLIGKLTKNKFLGALVGFVVTAVIQSSSATTVMVVGFVNAGIMTLGQAVGVIMGANIGTTVTGLMMSIKISEIAPIAMFVGIVFIMFMKKTFHKNLGQIIAGFGILFFGMSTMSDAMAPLKESEFFINIISSFSNPVVGVIVGVIFTAIIQSSSASTGVLISLATAGVITLPNAIFFIYGQNIGTCITAIISSIGASKAAKRTAVVHLTFNVIGSMLFIAATLLLPLTNWIQTLVPNSVELQISTIHILFNIISTAILLPLSNILIKIAKKVVPGEDEEENAVRLKYLDQRILGMPAMAVTQVIKEVERMSNLAKDSYTYSMKAVMEKDKNMSSKIAENEQVIDFLNYNITQYLIKINALDIDDYDRLTLGALHHVVTDLERIGDHCENICELAEQIINETAPLSSIAQEELRQINELVFKIIEKSIYMFMTNSYDVKLVNEINSTEDQIDDMTQMLKENHIERLNKGECTAASGAVFMDLLTNLERIADHCTNVAFCVYERTHSVNKISDVLGENTVGIDLSTD